MTEEHPSILPPGRKVEDYRIESTVGAGAMAVVYRAVQENLSRPVALKILPREYAQDPDYVERFFNEAKAAATLSHPNVVHAFDAGITDDNIAYFAMEYVEGETALSLVESGKLSFSAALNIAVDIARALNYGWEHQELTHGDIKPANIMLTPDWQAKLADFGLAKAGEHDFKGDSMMLTPLYAAPEAIEGEITHPNRLTDIYAFGATLYHMFAGEPPFPGDDGEYVMQRQVEEELTPASERNTNVPEDVSEFLSLLLAKSPRERIQDWGRILQRLESLAQKHSSPGKKDGKSSKPAGGRQLKRRKTSSRTKRKSGKKRVAPFILIFLALLTVAVFTMVFLKIASFEGKQDPPDKGTGTEKSEQDGTEKAQPSELADSGKITGNDKRKRMAKRWARLKEKIKTKAPKEALQLLKDFQKDYPDTLPEDFASLHRKYRKKAEKPTEARKDWRLLKKKLKDIEDPLDGLGLLQQYKEKYSDVLPEDFTSVYNKYKERMRGTKDVTAGEDREEATTEPGEELVDAYVRLINSLKTFPFRPYKSLEPVEKLTMEWIKEHHPPDSDLQGFSPLRKVRFIQEEVLPSLRHFKEALEKNESLYSEEAIEDLGGFQIKDFKDRKVSMEKSMEDGNARLSRSYPWKKMINSTDFTRLLADIASQSAASNELRQTSCAFLCFRGEHEALKRMFSSVSQSDDKDLWHAVTRDFANASTNREALKALKKCFSAYSEEEMATVRRLLPKIRSASLILTQSRRDKIQEIKKKLREEREKARKKKREETTEISIQIPSPKEKAEKLLKRASKKCNSSPKEAVNLLTTVQTRYGKLLPQKIQKRRHSLLEKAVQNIRQKRLKEMRHPEHLRELWYFRPVARANTYKPAGRSMAKFYSLRKVAENLPSKAGENLNFLETLALFQTGEWHRVSEKFRVPPLSAPSALPPRLQAAGIFTKALLQHRYSDSPPSTQLVVSKLKTLIKKEESQTNAARIASLGIEYALYTDSYDISYTHWPSPEEFLAEEEDQVSNTSLQRYILDKLAWLITKQELHGVKKLLRTVSESENMRRQATLTTRSWNMVKEAALTATNEEPLPDISKVADAIRFPQGLVRLYLSILKAKDRDNINRSEILASLRDHVGGHSRLTGKNWFDQLLLRVGEKLRKGQKEKAFEIISSALQRRTANVSEFYPRLRLLQCGTAVLAGASVKIQSNLADLRYSPVLSSWEKKAIRRSVQDSTENVQQDRSSFWATWLRTAQYSHKDRRKTRQQVKQMKSAAGNWIHHAFALDLQKYINQGQPLSNR